MNESQIERFRLLARWASAGSVAVVMAAGSTLPAQTEATEENKEQRVVVTGSRISRLDVQGPSPVYTIDRQAIENAGVAQVSELLRNLPLNSGISEADAVASFAGDSASVNLRGFGVGGTLVLLNGRRLAPHAFANFAGSNFVDLNSVPPAAIERIEVLKDGASAVYGSDALAGVINIILRNDFEGAEVDMYYGDTPNSGDFHVVSISSALGVTSGKGSIKVFTNYYDRSALGLRDRGYVANANFTSRNGYDFRSGSSYPGRFRPTTATPNSNLNGGTNVFTGDGRNRTFTPFNFNDIITAYPEAKRYGINVMGDYAISDTVTAFTELTYQRNYAKSQFAPAPSANEVTVPATNPYNPTNPANTAYFVPNLINNTLYPNGIPLLVQFRPMDPGNRIFETTTQMVRAIFGAKGEIGDNWNWEAYYNYSISRVDDLTRNLLVRSELQAALDRTNTTGTNPALTALNPFALTTGFGNNQAIYNAIKTADERNSSLDVSLFAAQVTGDLFDLPAGPVGASFGAEYREEAIEDLPSGLSSRGLLIGSGGTSSTGARDGSALFGEVSVPVIQQVELTGALRWEDYSDFSDSIIGKIGSSFRPTKHLLLRGSYSEGFKAPSLPQAYGGIQRGFPAARVDSILAAATGISNFGTDRQFASITGGNPALNPEESEYVNIGFTLEGEQFGDILKGFSIVFDYWTLDASNLITTRSVAQLLADEFALYQANPAAFLAMDRNARAAMTRVLREPNQSYTTSTNTTVTSVGRIEEVQSNYQNLESLTIEGFDLEVNYTRQFDFGTVDIRNFWVYYDNYESDNSGVNEIGTYNLPEYRYTGTFGWRKGDYGVSVNVNYVDEFEDFFTNADGSDGIVKNYTTYDLRVTYSGIADTRITVGIDNVLNEEAPFVNSDSSGFEPGFHDVIGRFVWISVNKKF